MQATSHILKRRCDLTKQNVIIRKFRTGGGEHEHERTAKANEHSRRHHTNRAGTRFRNTKLQAGPATNWYFKLIRISELTEVFAEPVRVQAFMNHTGECIAIKNEVKPRTDKLCAFPNHARLQAPDERNICCHRELPAAHFTFAKRVKLV